MHTKPHPLILTGLGICALLTAYIVYIARVHALFTADVEIRNNIIKTGSIAITVIPNEALFTADALLPGQTVTNSLDITNMGKSPAQLQLSSKKSAGYSSIYDQLQLVLTDGERIVYSGPLKEVLSVSLTDKPLLPTSHLHLDAALTLPDTANATIDNLSTTITFTVHAIQAS